MPREFTWHGDEIVQRATQALIATIDETTKAIADKAEGRVRRRTGDLARSVRTQPAKADRTGVEGWVGFGEFYALFEEINRPYLRPSVDSETPQIVVRLKGKLK